MAPDYEYPQDSNKDGIFEIEVIVYDIDYGISNSFTESAPIQIIITDIVDENRPGIIITSPQGTHTNISPASVNVFFTEDVTGFEQEDISVVFNNAVINNFVEINPKKYF